MAYCTLADVEQRVGGAKRLRELTDWQNTGATVASVVDAAIADVDALIDSFAAKRFSVPFADPVPSMIRQVAAELAALTLKRNRGGMADADRERYAELAGTDERQPGWLLLLARGIVTPGTDPMPTKHSTMVPDRAVAELPSDRDVSRAKTTGFW